METQILIILILSSLICIGCYYLFFMKSEQFGSVSTTTSKPPKSTLLTTKYTLPEGTLVPIYRTSDGIYDWIYDGRISMARVINLNIPANLTTLNFPSLVTYNGFTIYKLGAVGNFQTTNGTAKSIIKMYTTVTTVIIPENVLIVDEAAFSSSYTIASISLPNTLQVIGLRAFASCNLKTVKIPINVMVLYAAFNDNPGLTSIYFKPVALPQILSAPLFYKLGPNPIGYFNNTNKPAAFGSLWYGLKVTLDPTP